MISTHPHPEQGSPGVEKRRARMPDGRADEHGSLLPHTWVAGDDEMGRPTGFRLELSGRNERYLLAVPANTLVRDIDAAPPEYSGRGRHPKNPFVRVDRWCATLS